MLTMLAVAACRSVASAVLDLPPREPAATPSPAPVRAVAQGPEATADTTRPPIEGTTDPDSALALLPRDSAGRVDWVAAVRDGVVRPRRSAKDVTGGASGPVFAYDFAYRGPDEMFDAVFPHSAHVAWMDCQGCHPAIFRYRGDTVTMTDINEGRACGVCHRTVAFSASACDRCHKSMPAAPAEDSLTVDIVFARDSAALATAGDLPPSLFPHWVHRVRYACTVCHPQPFAMRRGGTGPTMATMQAGGQCGACHDGRRGFGLLECGRCHVSRESGGPPPG